MSRNKTPAALAVATAAIALALAGAASAATFQMTLKPFTTTSVTSPPMGNGNATAGPDEIDTSMTGDEADGGDGHDLGEQGRTEVNRTIGRGAAAKGVRTAGRGKAKSNPELVRSIDGINFFQQRFANNGNQFSIEPPDQALCVGNGYVLESVNTALRIFDTTGAPKTGVIDLNTFYGYIPAITRSGPNAGQRGPAITDPVCLYDADTQRWFHVVLTLDKVGTSAANSGRNHLDIAVSTSPDPTGTWVVYQLPVQNDGTDGTPNHGCQAFGPNNTLVPGPCLGDYPHIGADANGIYLTTNEFDFFGPFFRGAQVYAISKHALASLSTTVPVESFNLADLPSFTVWPAQSPGTQYATANGGTEFLASSLAVFEDSGVSNEIIVYSLTNTQSLNTLSPNVGFDAGVLQTVPYGVPPRSNQKSSTSLPLRDCIADPNPACRAAIGAGATAIVNPELTPDSNDSRMQQVVYANGKLWAALDTGLLIDGDVDPSGAPIVRAGIAYFVFNPNSGVIFQQGYVGLKGNNVSYPTIAVTESGRGAMGFSLMGNDYFPSAAYTSIDAKVGAGDIHVAATGVGPQDGFAGYRPLGGARPRPRWGDYGAAAADGDSIWFANEYINQTCTYAQYKLDFTCGQTRASLGNWGTRITQVKVK